MFEELEYRDGKLYRNGVEAGWLQQNGYRMLSYRNKKYLTHRVVWYKHHGKWPDKDIDHIDQDRSNNRIENLRDVSESVNLRNQKKIRGYHRHSQNNRWIAQYSKDNKTIYVGSFHTEDEARAAYLNAIQSA